MSVAAEPRPAVAAEPRPAVTAEPRPAIVAELRQVSVQHLHDGQRVPALTQLDLQAHAGEILGIAGESGAGKTTLARCLLRLLRPNSGEVLLEDQNITTLPERRLRKLRGRMTMVFRDPTPLLNPRLSVRALIEEPLLLHSAMDPAERRAAGDELATQLGLQPHECDAFPPALATSRLQLVALARAIATRPRLIVLDEPTALLDAGAAADLLGRLAALRTSLDAAIVLLTHDMAVLRGLADRIIVLLRGRIVEQGPAAELLADPLHPYAQTLLSAHLAADPRQRDRRIRLRSNPLDEDDRPAGCDFAALCPLVEARCRDGAPTANPVANNRLVACVRAVAGTSRIPSAR